MPSAYQLNSREGEQLVRTVTAAAAAVADCAPRIVTALERIAAALEPGAVEVRTPAPDPDEETTTP